MESDVMTMLRRRDRLVSFRLSEQEYDCLRTVSIAQGARSISDYARTALQQVIVSPTEPAKYAAMHSTMDEAFLKLTDNMRELSQAIGEVLKQIEKQDHEPEK